MLPNFSRRARRKGNERASNTDITLAGIPVAPADETKRFKLIGTTGTGKNTAIQEILAAALARGDRAIIADPDGGHLPRFYDEDRDVILNPFDGWRQLIRCPNLPAIWLVAAIGRRRLFQRCHRIRARR